MEDKFPASWDTKEKNLFAILKLFSVVSHKRKNPLLLYPTTEENLLHCIPQRKKTLPSYPTTEKNVQLKWLQKFFFLIKMTLTHESGSQEDQFDE
jgi:hypothetical protein